MEGMVTVAELITQLQEFPGDALVMVPVIKYPGEFELKQDREGKWRWDNGTDVEVIPFEQDDLVLQDGQCWLVVELTEYNEERAMIGGTTTTNGS